MQENLAIDIKNLSVAYGDVPVLDNINLQIPSGNLVAILGPNGAGKTTLLKSILGLLKPVCGSVSFPLLKNIKNKIAYVPQSESVDWDFPTTVLDVVMMGIYGHLGLFNRPKAYDKNLALQTLSTVSMQDFCKRQINQLSGGQKQRVFLARALVQQADIYLLDEPFKGVDIQTEKTIINLLKLLKKQGKTVIVVHHDLQTVSNYFDWVTLINKDIIQNGYTDVVFNEINLQKTYKSNNLINERFLS